MLRVEVVTEEQNKKTLNIKKSNWSETANDWNTDELTIDNIRYKRYNGVWKIWNTRLYTGREYDAELKLYYNRARYYSPDLGRFISRDPIDVNDDVNLYAYVGNNGVMYVDRNGLSKILIIWFTGYPGPSAEFDNNDSGIYKTLEKFKNNTDITTLFLRSDLFENDIKSALKYINDSEYNSIVLLGHSLWANSAVELTQILNKNDIDVSLLVTLDICGWYACFSTENEVPNNVLKTVNYYQENDVTVKDIPWLYNKPLWQIIDWKNPVLIPNHFDKRLYGEDLVNQDITNTLIKDSYHTTIDNDLVDIIYNLINTNLWY